MTEITGEDRSGDGLIASLLQKIKGHPLLDKARRQKICRGPDLIPFDRQTIERMRIEDEHKQAILAFVNGPEDECPTLSFFTASEQFEPLSGSGRHYMFFFSPDYSRLLHAGVGTWKA